MRRHKHLLFGLLFLGSLLLSLGSQASPALAAENKISFDAQAILPENQQSQQTYYDLKVQPGTQQELKIDLRNTSQDKIAVKIAGNNAVTNQNGTLDYSKHGAKLLDTPTFEELISPPQTIELKPAEERIVTFQLTIPQQGFKGTVLGGFYCYQEIGQQDKKIEGLSLANRFAYTIGAQLTCSDEKVEPNLALTKVQPGLDNGYLTVFATIENSAPAVLSQADMQVKVTQKGKRLHEFAKKISIAPISQFKLPINWEDEPLKKGSYQLTVLIKDASGQKWSLTKGFTIKGDDEKLNKQAVNVKQKTTNLYYWLIALCVFVIFGLILYIFQMKQKLDRRG